MNEESQPEELDEETLVCRFLQEGELRDIENKIESDDALSREMYRKEYQRLLTEVCQATNYLVL